MIVPCRNEARSLNRFLDSLNLQDMRDYDWEILIADGMSDDGTRELLAEFARSNKQIQIIDNPARITPTGLNAAILAAKGEVILRMDVHTEYAPDYIRRCIETLHSTKADNVGGPARTRAVGLIAQAVAAAYHSRFACGGAKFHQEAYEGKVDTVPYGCWRKKTLERLGLFDPELVRNQDDDLNFRLIRQGGTIWQSPAIQSWYSPRSTLSALFKQYYQYGFWKVAVIRKYGTPASWRHLAPGAFVLTNMALFGTAFTAFAFGQTFLFRASLLLLALMIVLYSLCVSLATALTARSSGWKLAPYLPPIFATYHVSYGLGFVTALGYAVLRRFVGLQPGKVFTQVTR